MYTHTCVYINVYAYIYIDTYTYIYIHMHMHTYTHTCTHTYICMYMHTYTQIYTHTYSMYICTHASTPGTMAWQRLREKPDTKPGSSTHLPVRAAHDTLTTARHPDYTGSSILVRDQSNRSMAAPATEIMSQNRVHIPAIFPPFLNVSFARNDFAPMSHHKQSQ